MPIEISNVKRTRDAARATFDLILHDQGSEITIEGCALVKSQKGTPDVSFRSATVNNSVTTAVAAKVALVP